MSLGKGALPPPASLSRVVFLQDKGSFLGLPRPYGGEGLGEGEEAPTTHTHHPSPLPAREREE
jgi:hypothetical protein